MNYKNKFLLTGTQSQIEIVKHALDQIKFPWERLKFPNEPVEIGWSDLNTYSYLKQAAAKHHEGKHPDPNEDILTGSIDGRNYVLGVFYINSGKILIDNLLVQYPEVAMSTVSAEIAHAVDYFLPLTDEQRDAISTLMHGGDSTPHSHTWWEVYDYGTEYFTLLGEGFMQAFTVAYSDIDFDTYGWTHFITSEQAPALRKILGIERTDAFEPYDGEDDYEDKPTIIVETEEEKPPKKPKKTKNTKRDDDLVSKQKHEAEYIAHTYKIPIKVVREAQKFSRSRRVIYSYLRELGYDINVKNR